MKILVVTGTQWGDEGKGKLINFLAKTVNFVIRWSGGDNAGHVITTADGQRITLSSLPTGILMSQVINIIGPGALVNPLSLVRELKILQQMGYRCNNLFISARAHLIFPYHIAIDMAREKQLAHSAIGTTKKGIGPCCEDRAARIGIRVGELTKWAAFTHKFKHNALIKNQILTQLYQAEQINVDDSLAQIAAVANLIRPITVDVVRYFRELSVQRYQKARVLCEGAQGALLDLDFGTYPYVTSSRSLVPLAIMSSGLRGDGQVVKIGVVKAYNSRVGGGPFVSEIKTTTLADYLVRRGGEFGSVTGRKRRVGWLDLVALRHSCWINHYDVIAIMLVDVLDDLAELKLCTAYNYRGKKINYVPSEVSELMHCTPHYTTVDGWKTKISHIKRWVDVPSATKRYLNLISHWVQLPIAMVSVGPRPEQIILLPPYYNQILN